MTVHTSVLNLVSGHSIVPFCLSLPDACEAIGLVVCLFIFCLTPSRLYGLFCLFSPDTSVAILALFVCFRLIPLRLYDICCLFVYLPYMACRFLICFPPDASETKWHVLFVCLSILALCLRNYMVYFDCLCFYFFFA